MRGALTGARPVFCSLAAWSPGVGVAARAIGERGDPGGCLAGAGELYCPFCPAGTAAARTGRSAAR